MRSYYRRDIQPKVSRFTYPIHSFAGVDAETDENALPLNWASDGYNISIKNGVLTNGVGVNLAIINGKTLPDAFALGSRPMKAAIYYRYDYEQKTRDDRIVCVMHDRRLYHAKIDDRYFSTSGIQFASHNVTLLNYHYNDKDCMVIAGDDGQIFIFDGTTFVPVTNAPKLTAACVYNERVYGTMNEGNNRVYFSDDLNPTNWNISLTEGGYLSFPDEGGKVMGVLPFKGSLYIFREYAIHRLTAYVDQQDYTLNKVYSTNNMIYARTAAVCNDKIVFLTDDGFYKTDGYTVTKILKGLYPLIAHKRNVHACFFNNKYYLSAGVRKDDKVIADEQYVDVVNNGMIIYDFDENNVCIFRGTDIGQFMPVSIEGVNVLVVLYGHLFRGYSFGMIDNTGKLSRDALPKVWRSPYSNFESLDKDKVLKKIYINADTSVTLKTKLDKEYAYSVQGTNGVQMIPVNRRADKVGIEFSTNSNTLQINGMLLEFDFIRRKPNE